MGLSAVFTPLSRAEQDKSFIIQSINGDSATARRLRDMGFNEGARVTPLQKTNRNMVIALNGVRMGLSVEAAGFILVEPVMGEARPSI